MVGATNVANETKEFKPRRLDDYKRGMATAFEQVLYEVADPVATITLNRPELLNAWTARMGHEVAEAIGRAERDPAVVGIILTGAGRGFCAGADLRMLASSPTPPSTPSPGGQRRPDHRRQVAGPGDPDAGAGPARHVHLPRCRSPSR